MSVPFARDADEELQDELPDRPISPYRNLVTLEGLAQIEAEVERLQHEWLRGHAKPPSEQTQDEQGAAAHTARDLRYWTARRSTAELAPLPKDATQVHFGSRVTILRKDGRRQAFQIVGEDEADPALGLISYVSALAQALMSQIAGETVQVGDSEVTIEAIT